MIHICRCSIELCMPFYCQEVEGFAHKHHSFRRTPALCCRRFSSMEPSTRSGSWQMPCQWRLHTHTHSPKLATPPANWNKLGLEFGRLDTYNYDFLRLVVVPCNKSATSTAHHGHIPLPSVKLKRCVFKIPSLRPLVSSCFPTVHASPSHQKPGLQFADTEVDPWNEAKSLHRSWRNTACPIRLTFAPFAHLTSTTKFGAAQHRLPGSSNMVDTKSLFAIFSHILFVAQLDVPHMNEQKFARCGFIIHQGHLRH